MEITTQGKHLLLDLWLKHTYHEIDMEELLNDFIEESGLKAVNCIKHKFEPQGMTIIWILAESHCSVHMYPEHNYLSIDIYTCARDRDIFELRDNLIVDINKYYPISLFNTKILLRGREEGMYVPSRI